MTDRPAIPFGQDLGYAVNTIDRLSASREDEAAIEALRSEPGSRTAVLMGEQVVFTADATPWFDVPAAAALGLAQHTALLGRRDGRGLFAVAIDADQPPDLAEADGLRLHDLRALATEGALPPDDLGALAQAKALFHWHRRHRFCANCGAPTRSDSAGWRRTCPPCGAQHFPRTDPVVIMMAIDGERCLLGRQSRFPPGMYSCLAGFMEPGETIEAAVRRELGEEAGIAVGAVLYLGSQPWPFPASIMIGCLAEATTTAIALDDAELEDARWFSKEETRAMLEGRHREGLRCPPAMAIAHHLMRAWATGAA